MIAGAAACTAQRVDRIGARCEPRGSGSEDDASDERQAAGERQHQRCGANIDGQECGAGKCERQQQSRGPDGDEQSGDGAADGEEDALDQRLRDDLAARGAHRKADRGLTAPRDTAGEQQVRDVRARDQQDQPAHAEQNLEAACGTAPSWSPTPAPAGTTVMTCLGSRLDDPGQPVRGIRRVGLHPLAEDAGHPRAHPVRRRAGPQPADDAQPRGDRLAKDRRVAVDQRLLLQGNPEIGRIGVAAFRQRMLAASIPTTVNGCPSMKSGAPMRERSPP